MRLIYPPDAEAELIDAAQFYEGRVSGLGVEFLDAVESAVVVILHAPERSRVVEADIRRYMMPRFPYAVYYRIQTDDLRVLAIKHHRQHPDYWRGRMAD